MKVCPTNVIQPTMLEAGLEGLWTPVVKTQTGYCEYECNMCNQVCPTEAIRPLRLEEKKQVRIGLAHLDEDRCLPLVYARPCLVCHRQCPARAISMIDTTVTNLQGAEVTVKKPHVNPETCIGCGVCEAKCPVTGRAAIRVTSVGETRHVENQFLSADRYAG
jgi:formate hydrogenlyase subunit 6/NADH:ubiquinone oxidoreductase subunit I